MCTVVLMWNLSSFTFTLAMEHVLNNITIYPIRFEWNSNITSYKDGQKHGFTISHDICPFCMDEKWGLIVLEIKVSCNQWEGSTCIHEGFKFVFWGGVGKGWPKVFYSPLFLMCSYHVPTMCPQVVPNSTLLLSHMVCPKFNSPIYKLKREHNCFYFATSVQRGGSIGECPMLLKNWWWANQNGSLQQNWKCFGVGSWSL